MFSKEKFARIGLLIIILIGIYGTLKTISVDYYAPGFKITWSMYVVYIVSFLVLGFLPLCFKIKYNALISSVIFSAELIPLLYFLDSLSVENDWFAPLGLPMALIILAQLWIFGLLMKILKFNKWFLSAIFIMIFGILTSTRALHYTSIYLGKTSWVMMEMNLKLIAGSIGIGVLFIVMGIISKMINFFRKKQAIH